MKPIRIFMLIIVLILTLVGYIFRKKISYPFCPLEKYTGRSTRGGKAFNIWTIHTILSFAFCFLSYYALSNLRSVELFFDDDVIRISIFILLLIIGFYITGLLIEEYLVKTDKEYQIWREKYLNKK